MKRWRVFFADWTVPSVSANFMIRDLEVSKGIWRELLQKGAFQTITVDATGPEDVFMALNRDDRVNAHSMRSMSVGDVAVDVTERRAYFCANVGFVELADPDLVDGFTR